MARNALKRLRQAAFLAGLGVYAFCMKILGLGRARLAGLARESSFSGLRARVLALMFIAAFGGSFWPLALAVGDAGAYPFMFNALWRAGGAAGCFAILAIGWPRLLFSGAIWRTLRRRIICWTMAIVVIGQFDFALMALSLKFVDVSITAILGEMVPLFAILVIAIALRGRHGRLTWRLRGLLLICFAGAILVGASQRGFVFGDEALTLALGCALALSGAAASGAGAFSLRWAADAAIALARASGRPDASVAAMELFCLAVAFSVATALMIPISGIIGLAAGETIAGNALYALGGGALLHGAVGLSWRCANLLSDDLAINALIYLVPILALAWLFLAGRVGVDRVDYLLIGVALIVGSNVAIAFRDGRGGEC